MENVARYDLMQTKRHAIVLRKADIRDVNLLKHWDEQHHVWESDPNDDWCWDTELAKEPEWREQLIAELDGRPIGFIQIIDPKLEESHYWGDVPGNLRAIDIWIGERDDLGCGYGTVMMHLALQRCFDNDHVTAVIIDPLVTNVRAGDSMNDWVFSLLNIASLVTTIVQFIESHVMNGPLLKNDKLFSAVLPVLKKLLPGKKLNSLVKLWVDQLITYLPLIFFSRFHTRIQVEVLC